MIVWNWKIVLMVLLEEHAGTIVQGIGLGLLLFGLASAAPLEGVCR